MAERARQSFAAGQAARPKVDVPVKVFAEYRAPTRAGETRVLFCSPGGRALPVFVNFHGGGFVMGSADDDDVYCRRLANAAGCAVVNADYRLAPEHKFPAALEDCYDVVRWVHDNAAALGVDPARIAVGGHSAGGNLAAAVCLLAKARREFAIIFQVLDYPPLDLTLDPYAQESRDALLTPKAHIFFNACYFNTPADARNPLVSPLLAGDLAGLPPALVIAAEYDPLRADGERYAARLRAAGVDATYRLFAGCSHAFTHFGPEEAADEAWALIAAKLREAFGKAG
jgi:acetyl esterase